MCATPDFSSRLIAWQREHGRHGLPWQGSRDPYRIWLSETMLQQTQVAAVLPYYQRFLARFPDVASLAAASLDEVLALWSGLGYYARARHLHRAACLVMDRHQGVFPRDSEALTALPGIGRSTAAAIAAFAAGERAAILDGNVKRVLARHFAVAGYPGQSKVEQSLWALATALLPEHGIEAYTQGLMDLGATLCTRRRPRCTECPLAASCSARALDAVERYPDPRPVRVRPQRPVILWLLRDAAGAQARLLLERRPPAGIWGGLWSLPEVLPPAFDPETAPAGVDLRLTHGFTHFVLDITVRQRRLRPAPPAATSPATHATAAAATAASAPVGKPTAAAAHAGEPTCFAWFTPAQAAGLGLPAPIRALLERVSGTPDLLGSG